MKLFGSYPGMGGVNVVLVFKGRFTIFQVDGSLAVNAMRRITSIMQFREPIPSAIFNYLRKLLTVVTSMTRVIRGHGTLLKTEDPRQSAIWITAFLSPINTRLDPLPFTLYPFPSYLHLYQRTTSPKFISSIHDIQCRT